MHFFLTFSFKSLYAYGFVFFVFIVAYTRVDNGSMGHGSIGQMGHIFGMGQWVMGQSLLPTDPLINLCN